jgi:hypothetical protein
MAGEVQKAEALKASAESSIAKVREAQKKFEETKKQVEDAKAKAEAAVKKAKELQQKIKETQALFRTPGGIKGGIAAIAASQIGTLRGMLVAQIQKQVVALLNKFSSGCPASKELQKVIKTRNTLINHLTSFEKRIAVFQGIAAKLTAVVGIVNALIKIITSIPIPTAIIPPMSGGIGIPISIPNKYSASLVKLNKILDRLLGDAAAILAVVTAISLVIKNLKDRLNSIDLAIQQCSIGEPADLNEILATAQPPENTGSEGTPNQDYLYKNYVLAIIQDPDSPEIAPRRYAVAKDRGGTIRLRGDSSFSSDTQVLLDEIKFRIDNQFT